MNPISSNSGAELSVDTIFFGIFEYLMTNPEEKNIHCQFGILYLIPNQGYFIRLKIGNLEKVD